MAKSKLFLEVKKWAQDVAEGRIIANQDRILAAKRFLSDLENPVYEMKTNIADFMIKIVEGTFVHVKGDLRGQPLKLELWEKFIFYNLAGFYYKGTNERRFKEALIYVPGRTERP